MANNCLVTKLKGSVNNESLNILGKIRTVVKTSADVVQFFTANNDPDALSGIPCTYTVLSGGYFTYYNDSDRFMTITVGTNLSVYSLHITDSTNGAVIEYDKYSVPFVWSTDKDFDLSDLKYTKNIVALNCTGHFTDEDINVISQNCPKIKVFGGGDLWRGPRLTGNITSLKPLTSLIRMNIHASPNLIGSVDGLFNYWASQGKTGELIGYMFSNACTFSEKFSNVNFSNLVKVTFSNNNWTATNN